ncbi:rhomboid family intramembrane serine protease [Gilvibacter sp.]|uniref:rhomboid family intramembrane serine protease n=1 Tax=Gilvibacter sp. TaxID=2729997 RepID=UPI003F4A00C5
MALGKSSQHLKELTFTDQSPEDTLTLLIAAAKAMDWSISSVAQNGFKARTKMSMSSWSEDVTVVVEEQTVKMKSICTGQIYDWGKNKRNLEGLQREYEKLVSQTDAEGIAALKADQDSNEDLQAAEVMETQVQEEEASGGLKDFFSIFVPTEGYFITPILINLNILIFILMAVSGVDIMLPDNESLLNWGSNFKPLTMSGEWWRLVTSCFVHIGVFHLLMNAYALLYIGILLEPYLGKGRFLTAYLVTGILSSTASLYFNDFTISAGASGAIFGMYGVFLAMLTTKLIEKTERKALLLSIGVFVGYNLLNGFQEGIDNAAHIGGLVSGLILGYAWVPTLRKPQDERMQMTSIIAAAAVGLSIVVGVLTMGSGKDIAKFEPEMDQFIALEQKAMMIFDMPVTATDAEYLVEIDRNGIPSWEEALQVTERIATYDLPEDYLKRNELLKEYCQLRIESYKLIRKMIAEDTEAYQEQINEYNMRIDGIITSLSDF